MFAQSEEQWKERDEVSSTEYRRRITHEDFCNRNDSQQFLSQSSQSSTDRRKSTDYCGSFNNHTTSYPSHLWFRNDLRGCSRQQCRHCCCNCCNCCCHIDQQHTRINHNELIDNCHKNWNALNSTSNTDQFMESTKKNFPTIRIIPITIISKSVIKDLPNVQMGVATDPQNSGSVASDVGALTKAPDAPYYGPFRAYKIKITPAIIANATGRGRSIPERYLSKRKYAYETKNDKSKIVKHLSFVNEEMNDDKSDDTRIITSDRCYDINAKYLSNEFDNASTISKKIYDQLNWSISSTPKITAKLAQKNTEANYEETEGDRSMKELELLKYEKKERNRKTMLQKISNKNNEVKTHSTLAKKIPIKESTTYWHKRISKTYSQKLHSAESDHVDRLRLDDQRMQQDDVIKSKTLPITRCGSNELKSSVKIRQVQEDLREISNNSKFIISNKNTSSTSGKIISTNTGNFAPFLFAYLIFTF